MTKSLQSRVETLPETQRLFWQQLAPLADSGFVLYGGTAIALQLGHRSSIDFDFFSDRALDKRALADPLPMLGAGQVLQDQPDTWTLLAGPGPVKISFFGGIGHGRVGTPAIAEENGVQIASLEDLLATKLKVILQRIESKDYVDIAALLTSGQALTSGLAAGRVLYGSAFQPHECLKALTYFEGGDLSSLSETVKRILTQASIGADVLTAVKLKSKRLSL